MRRRCELLANTLHQYMHEIHDKNKMMKSVHSSISPWRSIENGIDVVYLKPTGSVCSELQGIYNALVEINPYSMVDLHDYLSSDNQKRYFMIKKLKAGLSVYLSILYW